MCARPGGICGKFLVGFQHLHMVGGFGFRGLLQPREVEECQRSAVSDRIESQASSIAYWPRLCGALGLHPRELRIIDGPLWAQPHLYPLRKSLTASLNDLFTLLLGLQPRRISDSGR